MGYSVLLSNYRRYFKLASYLATHTREPIVIAMGMPSLEARPLPPVGRCADGVLFRLGVGVAPLEAHTCCGAHLLADQSLMKLWTFESGHMTTFLLSESSSDQMHLRSFPVPDLDSLRRLRALRCTAAGLLG